MQSLQGMAALKPLAWDASPERDGSPEKQN